MSLAIKQITQTEGWKEIKQLFINEIQNSTNTRNIKETSSADHIKMEVMTRNEASKIINRVLRKIEKIEGAESLKKQIIYR